MKDPLEKRKPLSKIFICLIFTYLGISIAFCSIKSTGGHIRDSMQTETRKQFQFMNKGGSL